MQELGYSAAWENAQVYMARARDGNDGRVCVVDVERYAARVWARCRLGVPNSWTPYLVRIERLGGFRRVNENGDVEHIPSGAWELIRFAPSALMAWASAVEVAAREWSDLELGYAQVVSVGPVIDPRG